MRRRWESVAPLTPLSALPNQVHPLGPDVVIDRIPEWFQRERQYMSRDLGAGDWFSAEACLRTWFDAEGMGAPSTRLGAPERPNHEVSWELLQIANTALWLARPSALHIGVVITAEPQPSRAGSAITATILPSIRPHEKYAEAKLCLSHLRRADELAGRIQQLRRPSSVWTATRFLFLALTDNVWETRYIKLWVAIESLFGPENRNDIKYTISSRIAQFLNTDPTGATEAYNIVRDGYEQRSNAVHGNRAVLHPEQASELVTRSSDLMLSTESILLTTLRRILLDQELVETFSSCGRDQYLNGLTKGFERPDQQRRKRKRSA